MDRIIRQPSRQTFVPFALLVGITATPLSSSFQQANINALYDSIILSIPEAAANNVFWGDASIDPALANGMELVAGLSYMLSITNDRQLYELQAPVVDSLCAPPVSIPFVCWDPSAIYLRAIAPTTIGVILFPRPFV